MNEQFMDDSVVTDVVKIKPEADAKIRAFYTEALGLKEYAAARIIATTEDLKPATEELSIISTLKRAMEEKRKEYVQPLQGYVKAINDTFKGLMQPIEDADHITRSKILAYQKEQDDRRREEERINTLRMEAARAEMELKGELTEPVDLVEVSPEAPNAIRTEMGMAKTTVIWKFQVIDFSLLPDRFKMENATLIGKVVRAGEREIPGVRIYEEKILTVNTNQG